MISSIDSDETQPSETDFSNDEKSKESFLDSIEKLALRQKSNSPDNTGILNTELSNLSIDDYPEVESTEKTDKKINELKSIISSIENRSFTPAEIRLEKTFRIDYTRELNRAQLEAVTAINGPVLVIAGAGSGSRICGRQDPGIQGKGNCPEPGCHPGEGILACQIHRG